MILVDTNVLVDIASRDVHWSAWSAGQLDAAKSRGRIALNPVIYAEFSMGFASETDCQRELSAFELEWIELSRLALFAAGKAFMRYRQQGGSRTGVLPDFFIGAQARALGAAILTRDEGRYRTYFPDVRLITPGY